MIQKVFVDMDSVLVDFITAIEIRFDRELPDKFGYDIGLAIDRSWEVIKYDLDLEFWHSAPLMPWTQGLMKWLIHEVPEVYILTYAEAITEYVEGKLAWMQTYFPDLLPNLIITKHKHLMSGPDSLLIDDYPPNLTAWRLHSGRAVHVPARWSHTRDEVESFDIFEAVEQGLSNG